jgi:mevalonate kinase
MVTSASAAGKVILLGEHAVVYGRPAVAVPVSGVRATVEVTRQALGNGIVIEAQDLGRVYRLEESDMADAAHALQATVRHTLQYLGLASTQQALRIRVCSEIPIARGMGSGTAVATALVRALTQHYGQHLTARAVSDLVFQTEILLHGTPSGVDNTVVAFEKPVYFVKGTRADVFWVGKPFTLLIADTGIPSQTRDAVAAVRRGWQAEPVRNEMLFDEIAALVDDARQAMACGDLETLGQAMNANQRRLQRLGVSSPELERLVAAALGAGAGGAKLSGGGMGGCMIALVDEQTLDRVAMALQAAGAQRVLTTVVR